MSANIRMFWLAHRTRLFVQYTISLSPLCKLIRRDWTYYQKPVRYILSIEWVSKIKHILSVIRYTICGAVCFQFTHFHCGDWESIYTLSYFHQIGSMNCYPLFRVRSWNKGVHCMSFYILITGIFLSPDMNVNLESLQYVGHHLKTIHPSDQWFIIHISDI